MKRIFVLLFGLLLIGAGCSAGDIEGDWYLSFDLPDEWVMIQAYREADSPEGTIVSRDLTEVFLQSEDTHMIFGGAVPEADAIAGKSVQTEDMTRVSVLRLDERRLIPSEADDLGDGWYQLAPCIGIGEGDLCEDDGESMTYYFESDAGNKYMLRVSSRDQDLAEAEEVIFTAQEVTVIE